MSKLLYQNHLESSNNEDAFPQKLSLETLLCYRQYGPSSLGTPLSFVNNEAEEFFWGERGES